MNKNQKIVSISPNSFKAGVFDIMPMLLGTAPFGLIFGAFAIEMNMGLYGGQGLSIFVFAGSSQFVGANLYGQGASIIIIFITTLFINLRHSIYGAALGPKMSNISVPKRVLMSFFITDEAFAVVSRFNIIKTNYFWGTALAMFVNWQIWTFVGLVFGSHLKASIELDIGYIMVPAFISIIVPQIKTSYSIICAVMAASFALIFINLPYQSGIIIAAILAITATMLLEYLYVIISNRVGIT
jgi:4-azaleucine resistance transporter AzlC